MIIINASKDLVIISSAQRVNSILEKTLGLLTKSQTTSLVFKTRFGIHTFFLNRPIDILILDKNLKVVKIKQNLKPLKLFFWNPKYDLVVELPKGSIKASQIQLNDIISFRD